MTAPPRDQLLEATADSLHGLLAAMRSQMRFDGPALGPLAGLTLHLIGRLEDPTPSALAEELAVTPATVTGALNKLEAAGLVRRERSGSDRRVVLLRRTAKGKRVVEEHRSAWRGMSRQVLGALSNDQLRQLQGLLEAARAGAPARDGPLHRNPPGAG